MRAYVVHNLDGKSEALVAARNMVHAARKLGMSLYDMRRYGWSYADEKETLLATENIDKIFFRPIGSLMTPWSEV